MVAKSDIDKLETRIVEKTRIMISEAVDPVKDRMEDFETRLTNVESRPSAASVPPKIQAMINKLDPAHRRVAFVGFATTTSAEKRISEIEKLMENFVRGAIAPSSQGGNKSG